MRNLFWLLLLVNVIFFAVMQRDGLGIGEQEILPQPSLHAEMIRLMPAPQSAPVKTLSTPAPLPASTPLLVPAISAPVTNTPGSASPQPLSRTLSDLLSSPPTLATVKPGTPVCLEWSDFSGADLTRAATALSALQLADKLSQRQIERDIGYWVYIPPLKNRAAVKRKIAELKSHHVREYFVVQTSGAWLNAISLGIFKTRDAAQHFMHELHGKGVRSARVGERASKIKSSIFVFNRIDAETETKLTAIQKKFSGSELKNIPCPSVLKTINESE